MRVGQYKFPLFLYYKSEETRLSQLIFTIYKQKNRTLSQSPM